ncbi:RNA-binding protein pop5 [Taxawa tesnikishii (nom. ined.)]|nr:RNA-binding protein pop5 [Dothideales sp. JES 119]
MVRLKHRYLLINILYPGEADKSGIRAKDDVPAVVQFHAPTSDALTAGKLAGAIKDGVSDLFGDYGAGMVAGSLQIKYLSPATSTAIVRVSRAHYRLVWAALTYLGRLPHPVNRECVIQVVRVSGTIRKSEEEAIRRAKVGILKAQGAGRGTVLEGLLRQESAGRGGAKGIVDDDNEDEDDEG